MLGPSIEEIAAILNERQAKQGPMIDQMRQLRDTYNGDLVIPLPEMDRREKSAVANLITTGLDQTAMRIASTMPSVYYPAVEDGVRSSEKRATTRKRATMGWWEANKMPLKMRRRSRWLIGYGTSPVILRPDTKWGAARWDVRDPLSTFPSQGEDPDDITPQDCIFTYSRSRAWLAQHYPDAHSRLQAKANQPKPSDIIQITEYTDSEVTVLMASSEQKLSQWEQPLRGVPHVELERISNKTGMCLVVMPKRITLDRQMGQFDSLVGMYQLQSKLMALEVIAVERGIFPDTYLVSRPGETARFVAGPYDGRSGQVNVVQGGDVREMAANPGFATNGMMDRIERAQRIQSGTPAEFGGESTTNVRTGKRGDAILSAVVDFPIQEAQEIFAASLQEENKRAIKIAKTYFGNERKSFYVSTRGAQGHVDYIPNKDFEDDNNVVTYSHSGADANSLVVGLGQRIGIGIMFYVSIFKSPQMTPSTSRSIMFSFFVFGRSYNFKMFRVYTNFIFANMVNMKSLWNNLILKMQNSPMRRSITNAIIANSVCVPIVRFRSKPLPATIQPGMGAEQPPAAPPGPQDLGSFLASLGGGARA